MGESPAGTGQKCKEKARRKKPGLFYFEKASKTAFSSFCKGLRARLWRTLVP